MATGQAPPAELLDRVQQLGERLDSQPENEARALAQELVATVIAMYGDGLGRIVAAIGAAGATGAEILDELAQDGAVASLLLIHDLYPVSLRERVLEALDTVRPYMESHGGDVELVALEDGVARLRLRGSCDGCAASRATLELAIKQALSEHAPDLAGLEVEGVSDPPKLGEFALPMVHSSGATGPAAGAPPGRWTALSPELTVAPGRLAEVAVDGSALVLANVGELLLAYRDRCAACGEPLHDGELLDSMLRCRACGAEFDLRRAGRAAGGEPLQLEPIPLLDSGGVRVAVGG